MHTTDEFKTTKVILFKVKHRMYIIIYLYMPDVMLKYS